MSKHIRLLVLAVLAVLFGISHEAKADWAVFTPTTVGCFEDGTCFVGVSPNVPNTLTSCTARDQVRFPINQVGGEAMYKTALSAYLAGRQLIINTANLNNCHTGYARAWYLHVQ
jgi:hypothetical protein